ncbi:MAG TPA: HAMP domain-containing sensor histidine kinase [Nitrososphaeraceae archaeon]|nr:HAMP domain-containing sensor histidine kinase [Nitrososphaeraceae archaeon]
MANNTQNIKTEIIHGVENVIDAELRCFFANKKIDTCMNYTRPPLAIEIEPIKRAFLDAKARGVRLRYITEITKSNISYCKELMGMVNELRHLDGIKANFMISDTEYLAPVILYEEGKIASQIIYSNVKEVVEQQQYIFDTFWAKSIPAEEKIKEIEEGITHYGTRAIENPEEIIKEISRLTASSNKLDTCLNSGGMQYSYNHFFDIKKRLLERQKQGDHKGIRYITNIEHDILQLTRLYLDHGIQIKHLKNLPPVSFGISDKEIALTIEKMESGKLIQSLLISNEPVYVKHFTSMFEELWKNGIDSADRIKEIEEGIEPEFLEVINDHEKVSQIVVELAKSVKREALLLLPSSKGMVRLDRLRGIDYLINASQNGATINIICPLSEENSDIVKKISQKAPNIKILNGNNHAYGMLIVDNTKFLKVEIRKPNSEIFSEAIGFAIYSNSRHSVDSFKSFFELLWNERKLNEELNRADEMQKEFINIAAHELRTPIQPILGLSEVLQGKIKDTKQIQLLDAILRNAKRLQQLTEDILDVSKIESQSLNLNKQQFNINDIISNVVQDLPKQIEKGNNSNSNVKLSYKPTADDKLVVEADKARIVQVISNLLGNAVKFTKGKGSTITITTEKKQNQEVIIKIKDTGTGIDPEILPRLFSKFASKSYQGTGLGLYISKSIIEAHGGRMWAENNNNTDGEKGATFYFTLPTINRQLNVKITDQ